MRVLIRPLPQMLRDILERAVANEPGLSLVRESSVPGECDADPDVIVVGTTDRADLDGAPALLLRWPRSRVLLITTNGRHASVVRLQLNRVELGEISIDELMTTIREATRAVEPRDVARAPGITVPSSSVEEWR